MSVLVRSCLFITLIKCHKVSWIALWRCSPNVFVIVIYFLLVSNILLIRSFLLITHIKCLKGHLGCSLRVFSNCFCHCSCLCHCLCVCNCLCLLVGPLFITLVNLKVPQSTWKLCILKYLEVFQCISKVSGRTWKHINWSKYLKVNRGSNYVKAPPKKKLKVPRRLVSPVVRDVSLYHFGWIFGKLPKGGGGEVWSFPIQKFCCRF